MNSIDKIRYVLNTLFLIGTVVTVILYFAVVIKYGILILQVAIMIKNTLEAMLNVQSFHMRQAVEVLI